MDYLLRGLKILVATIVEQCSTSSYIPMLISISGTHTIHSLPSTNLQCIIEMTPYPG